MNKKQTRTATIKDMRSLTNAAEKHADTAEHASEKTRLYASAGREHADRAETAAETARIHADATREQTARAQNAHNMAASHARIAEHAAEDAATYAGAARICLLLTILINTIVAVIFYTLHN